jgi:hypothetical protein
MRGRGHEEETIAASAGGFQTGPAAPSSERGPAAALDGDAPPLR